MSAENVVVVRSMYEARNRHEFLGPPGLLDESVEYANPPGAVEPGVRRGLVAFGEAVANTLQAWEIWHMEPQEFEARGDHVAVALRFEGVAAARGGGRTGVGAVDDSRGAASCAMRGFTDPPMRSGRGNQR